jgi:hypothetical protein
MAEVVAGKMGGADPADMTDALRPDCVSDAAGVRPQAAMEPGNVVAADMEALSADSAKRTVADAHSAEAAHAHCAAAEPAHAHCPAAEAAHAHATAAEAAPAEVATTTASAAAKSRLCVGRDAKRQDRCEQGDAEPLFTK